MWPRRRACDPTGDHIDVMASRACFGRKVVDVLADAPDVRIVVFGHDGNAKLTSVGSY
jgi:hypothetical protein